jgi:hypothetical protein
MGRLVALALLVSAACNSSPAGQATTQPSASVRMVAGGCAGTVLSNAEPPTWAQGGWSVTKGDPWPVPWAMGSGGSAIAFVFAIHLVAGGSPRSDGSDNKVLWVVQDPSVNDFFVRGHPLDRSEPVIEVPGGPSIVDPPSPGCWTFQLSWNVNGGSQRVGTINLDVLPKGSLPS